MDLFVGTSSKSAKLNKAKRVQKTYNHIHNEQRKQQHIVQNLKNNKNAWYQPQI